MTSPSVGKVGSVRVLQEVKLDSVALTRQGHIAIIHQDTVSIFAQFADVEVRNHLTSAGQTNKLLAIQSGWVVNRSRTVNDTAKSQFMSCQIRSDQIRGWKSSRSLWHSRNRLVFGQEDLV